MAFGFAIDGNHDIFVDPGTRRIALFEQSNLTGRNLNTRLKTVLGEYILDNTYGIDYRTLLSRQDGSILDFETTVKDIIRNTEGVDSIIDFRFESIPDNPRRLSLSFSVTTTYGDSIEVQEVQIG